jgi:dTDP-4-dehydrorhamnose 3,5-epimerase
MSGTPGLPPPPPSHGIVAPMNTIQSLTIPEVKLFTPRRFGDHRGFFCETYKRHEWAAAGFDREFVQDNHSLSVEKGVVRGLHFQTPPHAQDKLIRVTRGSILDVAVDIRRSSPTFGRHVAAVLSADNGSQLLVPRGFAHGFVTLQTDTEVLYKVTDYYAPQNDKGLLWCDPDLGIDWPVAPDQAVVSDKDRKHPRLKELPAYF